MDNYNLIMNDQLGNTDKTRVLTGDFVVQGFMSAEIFYLQSSSSASTVNNIIILPSKVDEGSYFKFILQNDIPQHVNWFVRGATANLIKGIILAYHSHRHGSPPRSSILISYSAKSGDSLIVRGHNNFWYVEGFSDGMDFQ